VRFLGPVAEAELPALYSAATLFAFPSLHEGFGLPVLEAMACGTPVVVSDASSLPEVVGDAGVLVAPLDVEAWSNAMVMLLGDDDARRRARAAGLARSARFSWRGTATATTAAYAAARAGRWELWQADHQARSRHA
jgi:glycosyltransferase involved in cell wall biosynthesis